MTHNAIKTYYVKDITPVDDAYLFSTVYGQFKGIVEDDIVLLDIITWGETYRKIENNK
jgi:hypothetical protein